MSTSSTEYNPCNRCLNHLRCDNCRLTNLMHKNAQYCVIIGKMTREKRRKENDTHIQKART
jgi:hypothetical protein